MKIFSSLHALAALGVLSAAASAWAQVDTSQWKCEACPFPKGTTGSVDVGLGDVTDDSQKFGDYTGLNKKGGFLVLGGNASRRGNDGYYADLTAEDLGLDNRRLSGRAGREGIYSLRIGYQEIPRHLTEGAQTPFLGSGGNTLTLPGGFPAADTASMPLSTTLAPIDIGYKYKRLQLGGTIIGGRDWNGYLDYRHDERDGTKVTSGSFFSTAAQFAAPVNEKTDQGELGVAYSTRRAQATVSYTFSTFHNDNSSVTWSNPFLPVVAGANTGQLALAPDNQFQQLRGTAGYDITPTIRLSAEGAYGRLTQDDSFLPATLNASLAPSVPALPSSNLGGRVDTYNGNVRLTAAPMAGLRLTGLYEYDRRDNKTPVRTWPIVTTDMFVQPGTRTNTPFGYTIDRGKVLGDYAAASLPWHLRFSGAAEYEHRSRSYQEVVTTHEWTVWGRAQAQPVEAMAVSLKLAHASRDGSTYGTANWFYPENPLLRKFNLADRDRDSAELRFDYTFNEKVSLGVTADYADDDYKHSSVGLTSARSGNVAAELAVAFNESTRGRAFWQTQQIKSHQNGSQSFAGPDWTGHVKDTFDMLGIGVKHVVKPDKFDIGADVTITRSHSDTSVDTAAGAPPFPTATAKMDVLTLYGLYKLKDNMSIVGSYSYEYLDTTDWRLDGVTPSTVPNLLALGMQSPHYSLSVLRIALRYKF
ncbi:MAG TPA: MtrB/PioB family decaheme-associated outer membrane protein [Caldimonas sp.]|nr:MtrB/PioB family decaheme-associated outer membrane protein [Caldimonas sp.]